DFRASVLGLLNPWTGEGEFLGSLLADRSLAVREAALGSLAMLPGSPVPEAAAQILFGLVRTTRGLLKKGMEIDLPPIDEPPKGEPGNWLERFALVWPKPIPQTGWRESLLLRMIGLVDPALWPERLSMPMKGLVALARKLPNGQAWQRGVVQGMIRFGKATAAEDLLSQENAADLLPALPRAESDRLIAKRLADGEAAYLQHAMVLLAWSPELSRAIVRRLGSASKPMLVDPVGVAIRLSPDVYGEALAIIDEQTESRLGIWREALPLLKEMRATIYETSQQK
ncbi:MAG TPA: DUF5691 domain-containing protein, partial [Fimbriimonadaceae bacterium]|nr:DUF5691 domain-containing protein [Fimbriimonadaceae bacterium]